MKRILSKKRLFSLALLFGLMAFGFGSTRLLAQDAAGQWLPTDQAINALNQEVSALDAQLQLGPNEPLLYKRKFFYSVTLSIEEGLSVPVAIDRNYARFIPGAGGGQGLQPVALEPLPNSIPLPVWQGYYAELKQLLDN